MSEAEVFWTIKVTDPANGQDSFVCVAGKRIKFMKRALALADAGSRSDKLRARLVKVTKRPRTKVVSRKVTYIYDPQGIAQWYRDNIDKCRRITLEVLSDEPAAPTDTGRR